MKENVAPDIDMPARDWVKYLLAPFAAPVVLDIDEIWLQVIVTLFCAIEVYGQPTAKRLLMGVLAH